MIRFRNKILTGIISFIVCFSFFSSLMIFPVFTKKSEEQTALKNQISVAYSPPQNMEDTNIKITIADCPAVFLLKILPKNQKIKILCGLNFKREDYSKTIDLTTEGFEEVINYLGGVEIETPYGLPSPANTDEIIAKNEKLFVYGGSLAALLCKQAAPSHERRLYYCYVLGEVSLKFLNNGTTELYKILNKNAKTDISYTDYYDNYKALKSTIKYADIEEN